MAAIPNNPEMQKWYALFVLLLVFVLIYFVVFQGFVTEHAALNAEITDLEQDRRDYTELAELIPELQNRINLVKETVGDNTNFLMADTYNLGTAELTRVLKRIVSDNTDITTECQTVSNTPSKDRNPDQFEKIILKVRMRCQFEKMVGILLDIENHVPHLFVDNMQLEQRLTRRLRAKSKPVHPMLEVRFDLFAYMNKPIRAKKNDKK
jgi:hypothetical protein